MVVAALALTLVAGVVYRRRDAIVKRRRNHEDRTADWWRSTVFGIVFFGVLLFWPAGTFDYWQAWVFIAVFTVVDDGPTESTSPSRTRTRLQRRMKAGRLAETRPAQRIDHLGIMVLGGRRRCDQRPRSPVRLVDGADVGGRGRQRAGG